MDKASYDLVVTQTESLKAALKSLLLLDKAFINEKESSDPEVAAAMTAAFAEHLPGFDYIQQANTLETRFMVDNAIRTLGLEIAEAASTAGECVMSHRMANAARPSLLQLLDLARCLSAIQLGEATLFLSLIIDVADASAIDDAQDIFLYLEKCVPFLKAKFNFTAASAPVKLLLLRICNMLLRRLSRAQHVLLAGRIHIFLAQILPSTDRSAVNANGSVNEAHALEPEEVSEDMLDTDGNPINATLYKQFWSLQQVFQNPTKAIEPNLWVQVQANIKAVLLHFGRSKPTVTSSSASSAQTGSESLTVQYLNSPKLLHLQVRDAGFRRHFLVQCLILLHACSRKSLSKQDTFKIKQQGEADDLQELLYKELERTPQNGLQFARAIRQLMHHEDQWADWKLDGAMSFEKDARTLNSVQPPAKRRRVSRPKLTSMGTRELTRLWNLTPDNLSAVKRPHKKPAPTLREFLDPVIQEMDPEQGIEDQYKKQRETVYRWEALRQISKVSRASLANLLKSKDTSLEHAAELLFPADLPKGVPQRSPANLPEASELAGLPVAGITANEMADADSMRDAKTEQEAELASGGVVTPLTGADTGTDPTKALTPAEDVDMDKGKDLSNLDEKGKPLESQSLRNVTGSNKTPRQDGELKTENDTETGMLKTETHLRTPSTRSKGKDGAEDASAAQIQTEESRHKS